MLRPPHRCGAPGRPLRLHSLRITAPIVETRAIASVHSRSSPARHGHVLSPPALLTRRRVRSRPPLPEQAPLRRGEMTAVAVGAEVAAETTAVRDAEKRASVE